MASPGAWIALSCVILCPDNGNPHGTFRTRYGLVQGLSRHQDRVLRHFIRHYGVISAYLDVNQPSDTDDGVSTVAVYNSKINTHRVGGHRIP